MICEVFFDGYLRDENMKVVARAVPQANGTFKREYFIQSSDGYFWDGDCFVFHIKEALNMTLKQAQSELIRLNIIEISGQKVGN